MSKIDKDRDIRLEEEKLRQEKLNSANLGVPNQNQIPSTLDNPNLIPENKNSEVEDYERDEELILDEGEERDKEKEEKTGKEDKKSKGLFVDKREALDVDPINRGVSNQNQIPSGIEKPNKE
ncbi:hypothetical protein [Lagierella sp.]|uniref:hypothetical protein n=1 Tax=Lagierella sp. TaxID=2849657 RepID=UPI002627A0C2|nr:hypothetical protein [Lagierella sp.]